MPGPETVLDPAHSVLDEAAFSGVSRRSVLQSVRRHPIITLLPIVLMLAVAAAYSIQRTPVYTAEVRMDVGKLDLSQPGALNGFATATQALATAYSRAVSAEDVIQAVAKDTRLAPLEVRSRVGSTPIPDSPLFRIDATGTSQKEAIAIANSTAVALKKYVADSGKGPNPRSAGLLRDFRDKQERATRASQRLSLAQQKLKASQSAADRKAVAAAQAAFEAARLEATSASTAYTQSSALSSFSQSVDILAPATFATNDRRSKTQIYAFAALVIGGFIGAALATLTEDRRYRRALRGR